MSLENARVMLQGIMLLVFAAIAAWVSKPVGLALVAFMGVMKLQEIVTDWCPSEVMLKLMGLKRKFPSRGLKAQAPKQTPTS